MVEDRGRAAGVSRRRALQAVGATGLASLSGCTVLAGGGDRGSVAIAGSSTVYPVSKALAEEYFKANPDAEVTVSSTGTGAGFSNFFCTGKTDINDASREIKESERELCAGNGITPIEFQIATDALTIIANPENDWVDCLSFEELKAIWGPENPAQKWSDVRDGWPDREMNLYGPTSSSGTFDFFTETVMGEGGLSRADYQKTEQDNAIVTAVSRDKFALGYLGFSYYVESRSQLRGVPVKNQESGQCVEPTFETARRGDYPLSRPLYIYVAKESLAEPPVRNFVSFYVENSDSEVIRRVGYVPVTTETARENQEKLQAAVAEVMDS